MLDNLTELEIKLRRIYIDGQNYNNTAAMILKYLADGNVEAACIEFVRDSDKIPTWRTWGRHFKRTILINQELLGIHR